MYNLTLQFYGNDGPITLQWPQIVLGAGVVRTQNQALMAKAGFFFDISKKLSSEKN